MKAQSCWAHLIRDIRFLHEKHPDKRTKAWAERLLDRSRRLFSAWHRRDEMTAEGFHRSMLTHRDRFMELVRQPPASAEAANLAARFAIVEYTTEDALRFWGCPYRESSKPQRAAAHRLTATQRCPPPRGHARGQTQPADTAAERGPRVMAATLPLLAYPGRRSRSPTRDAGVSVPERPCTGSNATSGHRRRARTAGDGCDASAAGLSRTQKSLAYPRRRGVRPREAMHGVKRNQRTPPPRGPRVVAATLPLLAYPGRRSRSPIRDAEVSAPERPCTGSNAISGHRRRVRRTAGGRDTDPSVARAPSG